MPVNELDPRAAKTSLADLSRSLGAPIALVSAPENQFNGRNAMKTVEQLTEKLNPEFESKVISMVDFMGSTSGVWTSEKIRAVDEQGNRTYHSGDFDRDLTSCPEFTKYLQEHHADFESRVPGGDETRINNMARKGFAIKNSQWNSYWRGKIAGGLTMALSMMTPKSTTADALNKCGIGALIDMDYKKLHVVIAACIDGGPVIQEEQRTITTMVDEVVFDLRRRGPAWAKNAAILILRFPDVESFVKSLDGERNLMRATTQFPTRQRDECKWKNVIYTMGLAWEVPQPSTPAAERGQSLLKVDYEKALKVENVAQPQVLLQIAKTGDTVGVKRMIDAKCPIEEAKTRVGFSALHACAYGSFADTAQVILKAHCNQQYLDALKTPEQITPLFFAAQFGAYETAKLLLEKGATVNIGRNDGQSPLYKAAHKGHKAIVEMMVQYNADVHKPADDGSSPLFIASQHGMLETVEYLISQKADINKPMNGGVPPIAIASQMGKKTTVELLVKSNAEVNKVGNSGQSAVYKAAHKNFPDILDILIEFGADTNQPASNNSTPVLIAAQEGNTECLRKLLDRKADMNTPLKGGATPLSVVAQNGHIECAKLLIENGADLDEPNSVGQTPLSKAAQKDQPEIAKLLVQARADMNKTNQEGKTPLKIAQESDFTAVVYVLT